MNTISTIDRSGQFSLIHALEKWSWFSLLIIEGNREDEKSKIFKRDTAHSWTAWCETWGKKFFFLNVIILLFWYETKLLSDSNIWFCLLYTSQTKIISPSNDAIKVHVNSNERNNPAALCSKWIWLTVFF